MAVGAPRNSVLSALGWSYGGAVLRALLQLAVQLMLARLLGPEAFGEAAVAFIVLAFGWLLSEAGFGSALVQKRELAQDDVGYALGCVLLLSLACGAVVVIGAPWIARWMGAATLAPLIAAAGVLVPLQALSNIPASLMRRDLDMRRQQFVQIGGYVVAYGLVGLPLAWAGAGAWTLIAAFAVNTLISLVWSWLLVRHTLRPRLRGDAQLRRFGLQVTGTNLGNWAVDGLDRVLVQRLWGTPALGEYAASANLSRAPMGFLVSSMQAVSFAAAARAQDETERVAHGYLAMLALVSLVTFPLFAMLSLHAAAVVHIAYGERWHGAVPLFAAFCAGLPAYTLLAVTGPVLWAVDAVRQELLSQLAGIALMVTGLLALALLARLPLAQAVWWLPVVYLFRMGWVVRALARRVHLSARTLARACAGGVLLVGLALAVTLPLQAALQAVAALVSAAVLLLALALALLWWRPRLLLAPDLVALMLAKAPQSGLVARVCTLLRLPPLEGAA